VNRSNAICILQKSITDTVAINVKTVLFISYKFNEFLNNSYIILSVLKTGAQEKALQLLVENSSKFAVVHEMNNMEDVIINRVESSSLITIDLESYLANEQIQILDISEYLFQGLMLREKEFRLSMSQLDTSLFKDAVVGIICSTDAIIPTWAYMLATIKLLPVAKHVMQGNKADVTRYIMTEAINKLDSAAFLDAKVVVKGCSELDMPTEAYVAITRKLSPFVSSLMFGEACSAVPLYKKPKPAKV